MKDNKNKLGLIVGIIVLLVILYIVFTVLKFFTSVALRVAWIGFIIFLVVIAIREITGKRQ